MVKRLDGKKPPAKVPRRTRHELAPPGREWYHEIRQLTHKGVEPYVRAARQFLRGWRTIPVALTSDWMGQRVTFTMSTGLLREIARDRTIQKAYEIGVKYGFLGYSRGGRNGIFYQRPSDKGLIKETDRLIELFTVEIFQDLSLFPNEFSALKRVKLVQHDPSGRRMVGVMNEENRRIMFLGFAEY